MAPQEIPPPVATDIVNNIPIHQAAAPMPIKDDDDLDDIMQVVGKELKEEDKKPAKRRLLSFKRAPSPKVKPQQPIQPKPRPQPVAQQASPIAPAQSQAAKVVAKQPKTSTMPKAVVAATVLVTGMLIAAAILAYK